MFPREAGFNSKPVSSMTRPCNKCGTDFEPTEGQIKKGWWLCDPCRKAAYREYRERMKAKGTYSHGKHAPEYWLRPEVIANMKAYRVGAKAREYQRSASKARWRDPEERYKKLARRRLQRAVQKGLIPRQSCIKCGKTDAEAHHEDYSRPFDVIWLCGSCHRKQHQPSSV